MAPVSAPVDPDAERHERPEPGVARAHPLELYMGGIHDGNAAAAFDAHIGERYTQHSTGVADGKHGFLDFFLPFLERTPERDIRVVRSIEDGRYVFCHAPQVLNGGAARWVTMDPFDTDSSGRIVEHWDVITPDAPTATGTGMVGGPAGARDHHLTDVNKRIVHEFVKRVLTERRHGELDRFVDEDVVEHGVRIGAGRAGWREALDGGARGRPEMLFKLVGEGDLLATYSCVHRDEQDHAVFDLYRLADRLIVEHWDASEAIEPRDTWNNSGKF